jgi:uncharacterized protein YbaP (TraB family)
MNKLFAGPRRRFAAILGGALLFGALVLPAAAKDARVHGQGRLYLVTAKGIVPSHVFGTMHATDPEVLRLPTPIARAFGDSTRLVLELVFTPEVEARLGESMLLSDGRRLSEIVGEELFSKLMRRAALYGIPAAHANRFRPWAAALIFSIPLEEMDRKASGTIMLDRALQQSADARGVPVYGLETLDEQVAAFSDMSERDQVESLRLAIALNPELAVLFAEMKQAYLAGDLDKLHAMSVKMFSGRDAALGALFEKRFIDLRNERMANRLSLHVKRGGAFVAVGALHLSGGNGILRLLEKRGYTVTKAY